MTLADIVVSLIVLTLFYAGLSQAVFPAFTEWNRVLSEYQEAKAIEFVAKSFKKECQKKDMDIAAWEKAVSTVNILDDYEVSEVQRNNAYRILKLTFTINGTTTEALGLNKID